MLCATDTVATPRRIIVLGAGISGLTCAYYLRKRFARSELIILESANRPGGVIETLPMAGALWEQAARGILPKGSGFAALELAQEIGLGERIIFSNRSSQIRYIYRHGRLLKIPGMNSTFRLLGISGTLNAILKDLRLKPLEHQDESVSDFLRRHFGEKVLREIFSPALAGTKCGDVELLSAESNLPGLIELERRYGSIIKGLIFGKHSKAETCGYDRQKMRCSYFSFKAGMSDLTNRLAAILESNLKLNSRVLRIKLGEGRHIITTQREVLDTDLLISTIPAYALASLIEDQDHRLFSALSSVRYSPLAVVSLAYPTKAFSKRGFGYLVSDQKESANCAKVLGVSWGSQVFPEHFPGDMAAFTVNIGGSSLEYERENREYFISLASDSLATQLDLRSKPIFSHCRLFPFALPQANVGHALLLQRVRDYSAKNFEVMGNFVQGVGVRDIIATARKFALDLTYQGESFQTLSGYDSKEPAIVKNAALGR